MKARIGDVVKVNINGKTFEFRVVGVGDEELVLQAPKGARWSLVVVPTGSEDEKAAATTGISIYQTDAEGRYLLQEEF